MRFLRDLSGVLEIRITGADPGKSLSRLNDRGVILYDVRWEEDLTVRLKCCRRDRKILEEICRKQGDQVTFLGETGIFHLANTLFFRPVLSIGLLLLLILTMFLPTRVLFVSVEGNSSVPDRLILDAAESCGLRFGVSRRTIRSEKIKNQLLEAIPELKWAGINTAGCTAVISVREHPSQVQPASSGGVSSIVAARDGRILSCTVTRGNGLCKPGQVVQKGQLLISGYTDCGICIRVTEAEGEVYAETRREIRTVTPMTRLIRQENGPLERRYSLLLGKKRINFWKGSGISPATCGRMYTEYYLTLPGGFRLPLCLRVETLYHGQMEVQTVPVSVVEDVMKADARKAVLQSSVAGTILREEQSLQEAEGNYVLDSRFFCREMIGKVMTEEIGETNGKTD